MKKFWLILFVMISTAKGQDRSFSLCLSNSVNGQIIFQIASDLGLINFGEHEIGELEKKYNVNIMDGGNQGEDAHSNAADHSDFSIVNSLNVFIGTYLHPRSLVAIFPISYSFFPPSILVVNSSIENLEQLKTVPIYYNSETVPNGTVPSGAAQLYMFYRHIKLSGMQINDFKLRPFDSVVPANRITNNLTVPFGMKVLFSGENMGEEIIDMMVANETSLRAIGGEDAAKAITEAFYIARHKVLENPILITSMNIDRITRGIQRDSEQGTAKELKEQLKEQINKHITQNQTFGAREGIQIFSTTKRFTEQEPFLMLPIPQPYPDLIPQPYWNRKNLHPIIVEGKCPPPINRGIESYWSFDLRIDLSYMKAITDTALPPIQSNMFPSIKSNLSAIVNPFLRALRSYRLICPKCHGATLIACPICNGRMQVLGNKPCRATLCVDGQKKCYGCMGIGKYNCSSCSGSGTSTRSTIVDDGEGIFSSRHYYKVSCTHCGGQGRLTCNRCGGDTSKRFTCGRCKGTGKIEGRITCSNCKKGKVICSSCEGTGELEIFGEK